MLLGDVNFFKGCQIILGDVKIFKGCLLKKGCHFFKGCQIILGDVKKGDGSFKNRDVNFKGCHKKGMSFFNIPISI